MHCKFKESQLVVRNPGTYILVVLYDEAFILLQFGWLVAATTCSCGARMKTTDSAPRTNHPHVAGSMQGYSTAGNVVDGLMHSAIDQTNLHGLTCVGFQLFFNFVTGLFLQLGGFQIGSSLQHPSHIAADPELNSAVGSDPPSELSSQPPLHLD